MASLFERYRPRVWGDVVGQDKAVGIVERLRGGAGLGGRAFWLAGPSGTGKTTIAKLIAAELADDYATEEIVGRDVCAADFARWARQFRIRPIGDKAGWAIVVNEAHGVRRDCIERFLDLLETLPPFVVFVFTTTNDGADRLFDEQADAPAFASRCVSLPMARRDLAKAFAERAREIAQAEGLDGQPVEAYVKLAQKYKNNFRAMLGEIENGGMLPD